MEKKIQSLEAIVERLSKDSPTTESLSSTTNINMAADDQSIAGEQISVVENPQNMPMTHVGVVMDLDSSPGNIPGFHIASAQTRQPRGQGEDFISRGVIALEKAQDYFDEYKDRLDHFPYRVLGDRGSLTLKSMRRASPLLTAAVCSVGALHSPSEDFEACYSEFITLSAGKIFSRPNTIDDVRALCIGSFWLSDASWTLVASAVQMATQLQLHKSFFKALSGDREHYLRTRLYLLIYVCDHHLSVPYGRPPMTRECEAIKNARKFLTCEHATEDDARLVSQVLRWSICSNIFDTLGFDDDGPVSDGEMAQIRRFGISLDNLRAEWAEHFRPSAHVGNYPRKGVGLQYHFAKLYLYSHALRGAGNAPRSRTSRLEMDEIAQSALSAALSIVRIVITDAEIQSHLNGLPTYFDTMIAFAALFLLKFSTQFPNSARFEAQELRRALDELVTTLRRVTLAMHPRHLLVSIVNGIDGLLQQSDLAPGTSATTLDTAITSMPAAQDHTALQGDYLDWNAITSCDATFDPCLFDEDAILPSQDMSFNLDFMHQ